MTMNLNIIPFVIFYSINFIGLSQDLYNNLIIKSEDSTQFIITINDFQQNLNPNFNIKVTHIYHQSISLQIKIIDSTNQTIEKQIFFEKKEMETNAKLIKKGDDYKFRFIGEVNLGQSAIDSTQLIVSYNENKKTINSLDSTTIVENINTDSSSTTNDSIIISPNITSYSGKIGCGHIAGSAQTIINELNKEIFSAQKLKLAKSKIQKNCFLSDDIAKIISVFEFDDLKLELAKFSYNYTFDIENYNVVIQILDFDTSKKLLTDYIQQL